MQQAGGHVRIGIVTEQWPDPVRLAQVEQGDSGVGLAARQGVAGLVGHPRPLPDRYAQQRPPGPALGRHHGHGPVAERRQLPAALQVAGHVQPVGLRALAPRVGVPDGRIAALQVSPRQHGLEIGPVAHGIQVGIDGQEAEVVVARSARLPQ